MQYPDSVRFLYALGNELKTAKFGLERIERLMQALGNPHRRPLRFVHVAGTNGKGSTCAMIESGLRAAGLRTGLFTSPHLIEPTERIRISGDAVSPEEFTAAFSEVHLAAEKLISDGELDMHPSYFETVTAMAFVLFRQKEVDITVLEVGLGGRLDATNIVEPELCVITPVDFDHEQFLGTSIEAIAFEKAGILKAGVPAVIAPQRAEADAVIRAQAKSKLIDARAGRAAADRYGSVASIGDLEIECCLRGRHQIVNAATAVTALQQLGVPAAAIVQGIRKTRWPGRLTVLRDHPEIIVDGAHNPSGARALAAYVAEFYASPQPVLIFGVMRDKAVEEMTSLLFPLFRAVIVTAPNQSRALAPETLQELVEHPFLQNEPNLQAALKRADQLGGPTFISGSLFLVSEAMQLLAGSV